MTFKVEEVLFQYALLILGVIGEAGREGEGRKGERRERRRKGGGPWRRRNRLNDNVRHSSIFAVGPGLDNNGTLCRFESVYFVLVPTENYRESKVRIRESLITYDALQCGFPG